MLTIWKHCAETFHYVKTSKLWKWIMVFHALMHDYEACENIFFKNPFQVQNLILTFHELLISCQFFMIFSSEV